MELFVQNLVITSVFFYQTARAREEARTICQLLEPDKVVPVSILPKKYLCGLLMPYSPAC